MARRMLQISPHFSVRGVRATERVSLLMLLQPTASVLELTILAALGTLVLAMLSWHLVEKPCMAFATRKKPRVRTA